jgi:hypothetical protein
VGFALLLFALCTPPEIGARVRGDRQNFSCPSEIMVTEKADAIAPWTTEAPAISYQFERAKIYNGTPGTQEFELIPDSDDKVGEFHNFGWKVSGYRDNNVFVRCLYHGTKVALTSGIPKSFASCLLRARLDIHNNVVGQSSLSCR